jgi:O-antigen/teichoic acid export membrane protein
MKLATILAPLMFRRTISTLSQSSGVRQSAILTGGNLFATVLSAIGLILISRTLGPTRFAEFSAGYSLLVIVSKMSNLGLSVAIPQYAGEAFQKKNWQLVFVRFLRVASALLYGVTSVLIVGGLVFAPWLAQAMGFSSPLTVQIAFACAAITVWFEYFSVVFQAFHRFVPAAVMMLVQASWKMAVAIIVVAWSPTLAITTLFLIFYASPFWGVALTFPWLPFGREIISPRWDTRAWQAFRRIAPHGAILIATTGVLEYVDVLFLQRWGTAYETGLYGGVVQIASLSYVIVYSLSAVLSARVARYRSTADIRAYQLKAIGLAGLLFLGGICTLPFVPFVISLTIGGAYLPAAQYLTWMLLAGIITIATVPFTALFYAYDRPSYFSVSGLLQLGLMIGGGVILIPMYGIWGAVLTRLITRGTTAALTLLWIGIEERKRV